MKVKEPTPEFAGGHLGWLLLIAAAILGALGVTPWSWWLLLAPIALHMLERLGIFRAKNLLTPLASRCTVFADETGGIRTYLIWYVFGICVLKLHLNR